MSVAGLGPMAITVGLFGVVFFVVGMSLGRQTGLSPEAIANWQPEGGASPRLAASCSRVDVTLDDPIRTSVLCGSCGHVQVEDGPRPASYTCPSCGLQLWDEEE